LRDVFVVSFAASKVVNVVFDDLGTTYTVHLRLIGKLAVDFLFVLIELFSLTVTAKALQANIN